MEKDIERTNRILQDYIEKTSEKINQQAFCNDKEIYKPCEKCILKEKCVIK
ncbi:hypothetical protein [Clostridium sp.]|uniref:hypothetical protein n=1 Tax=Clostridium sp. TaxID=1506 RepID=UPI002621F1B5|nr:hypothetical protein [Clostridium sp.]